MEGRIKVLAVVGPTASGKTRLAAALCGALGGEAVNADSMQVYEGLPVGTAQPGEAERGGIPHHLIGFLPVDTPFNVADYVSLAGKTIEEIAGRDKLPVLCGGTGLYVRSLLHHLDFDAAPGDEAFRRTLERRAQEEGGEALHRELSALDPAAAERVHPHNLPRVVRALELYHTTGLTAPERDKRSRERESPYDACLLGLTYRDRETLYRRINLRVDQMLEAGLLEEAEKVLALPEGSTAAQAIGYKELLPYLRGACSLDEAVEKLKQNTRNYAKRQLTWFKREEGLTWLYAEDYPGFEPLLEAALHTIRSHWRESGT